MTRNPSWKKPYRGSRAIDKTCRCHGGCPACYSARMLPIKRADISTREQIKEEKDQ